MVVQVSFMKIMNSFVNCKDWEIIFVFISHHVCARWFSCMTMGCCQYCRINACKKARNCHTQFLGSLGFLDKLLSKIITHRLVSIPMDRSLILQ